MHEKNTSSPESRPIYITIEREIRRNSVTWKIEILMFTFVWGKIEPRSRLQPPTSWKLIKIKSSLFHLRSMIYYHFFGVFHWSGLNIISTFVRFDSNFVYCSEAKPLRFTVAKFKSLYMEINSAIFDFSFSNWFQIFSSYGTLQSCRMMSA